MMFAALPLPVGLLLTFVGGVLAGAAVNWAVYALAWNRRLISPWSPPHEQAPPRRAADRLPVWGWLGLRRESSLHGRGYWARPLIVELMLGAGWAALYWWEMDRQGLLVDQFAALPGVAQLNAALVAPISATLPTFLSHALLLALMAAASLIDVDEKTIPDGVTVPGTLLGLTLAALLPMSLLPQAAIRANAPPVGIEVALPAGAVLDKATVYVEPVTLAAPNVWPAALGGAPRWLGLAIGLACFATWCFALTPRIWRGRRGVSYGLRVLSARVARELARPPLLWIGLAGALAIVGVWWLNGAAWVGLLSALVGMIGCGSLIWAVRIVGSAAMRREAMGFGDVTLMMMVGAFLGWQAGIFIFFIAPFAGLVVGILQIVLRRGDVIPYGPFLCMGALFVMVRWGALWNLGPGSFQAVFEMGWLVPCVLAVGVVMLGAMLVLWRNIKEAIFGRDGSAMK